MSNQEFIVSVLGNTVTLRSTSMEVNGLDRGKEFTFKVRVWVTWLFPMTLYVWLVTIQVQVSNGKLTSEPSVAVDTTFPRPPFPEELIISNTSLTCQVSFEEGHIQIAEIMVSADTVEWLHFIEHG